MKNKPAFARPCSVDNYNHIVVPEQERMSLRDYFAAQALVRIASLSNDPSSPTIREQARLCYNLADAMLEVREE